MVEEARRVASWQVGLPTPLLYFWVTLIVYVYPALFVLLLVRMVIVWVVSSVSNDCAREQAK